MASTLPNELLLHILEDALPYNFESLALTSKHMYAVSGRAEVVVQGYNVLGCELEDWTEQYAIIRFCMANGIKFSMFKCHAKAFKKCEDSGFVFKRRGP